MNLDQEQEVEIDDIGADIAAAMNETDDTVVDEPLDIQDEPTKEERARDEAGKFAKKEEKPETAEQVIDPAQAVTKIEAPVSFPAAVKAQWEKLPPEMQTYLSNREADIHKNMTAQDGDLRIGRDFKEVLTPYSAMFQHMGVAPKELVSDLMQKMHVLNTGQSQQKVALLHQIANQFGIDISGEAPDPVDMRYQNLEQKIQHLSQLANPQAIEERLQTRMLTDKVNSEVEAFKSDPANVHFEQVKTVMGSLISSGAAKGMKSAYDMACHADPTIRSTLQQANAVQDAEKRKAANDAKRKAGASVNGSPAKASPAPKAPTHNDDIGADIAAAFGELDGRI